MCPIGTTFGLTWSLCIKFLFYQDLSEIIPWGMLCILCMEWAENNVKGVRQRGIVFLIFSDSVGPAWPSRLPWGPGDWSDFAGARHRCRSHRPGNETEIPSS